MNRRGFFAALVGAAAAPKPAAAPGRPPVYVIQSPPMSPERRAEVLAAMREMARGPVMVLPNPGMEFRCG